MKKFFITGVLCLLLSVFFVPSALAVVNNTIKVGLKYGGDALPAANLENDVGSGYVFGIYDTDRTFYPLGATAETKITVNRDSGDYLELDGRFDSYEAAAAAASGVQGGFVVYFADGFGVRGDSGTAASGARVVHASATGVTVTITGTKKALFGFDCLGAKSLGILPQTGDGAKSVTWFKGYRYYGGFEYQRVTGGNLNVIGVLHLEDYVKGVIPYEMNPNWEPEALKAQAVCARSYSSRASKHLKAYGFDVCNTTDCQVYYGTSRGTPASDLAVDETAGVLLRYNGELAEAVFFSSDGGATEDAVNVWGSEVPYLLGKADPYEATIAIPNYQYSVSYTPSELTSILRAKGYTTDTIQNVYVSERTNMGNVSKVTFTDVAGKDLTVKRETCRTIFYSSSYEKSVRSMRFDIAGGSAPAGKLFVNNAQTPLASLRGVYVLSESGRAEKYGGETASALTDSGLVALGGGGTGSADGFTITGSGSGHQVGMSQYGAKAMAQQGCSYQEILNFYYTGVTIG